MPPGMGGMGMEGMGASPEDLARTMQMVGAKTGKKMTPEQQKYMELLRRITDATVTMTIKVASFDKDCRSTCPIFKQAQEQAKIVDELQEVTPPQGIVVRKVGKNRR
jgi:hypothetical protein